MGIGLISGLYMRKLKRRGTEMLSEPVPRSHSKKADEAGFCSAEWHQCLCELWPTCSSQLGPVLQRQIPRLAPDILARAGAQECVFLTRVQTTVHRSLGALGQCLA